jgi:O-antigen ligase
MKPEHALAMILVPLATLAAVAAASCFRRVRDLFFLLIVGGSVLVERLDVNFFSEAWYRGTTRGVQISLIEILAAGLLVGCWLNRGEGEDRRRWFWPGSLGLILAFFAYAGVSIVAADDHRLYGLFELSRMFAALLVFLAAAAYVRSQREWTLFVAALAAAVAFESAWAIKQHFVTHLDRAVASLTHANSLSMYLCLTVPPLVAFACSGWSRWLRAVCGVAAALGTVGILLTLSRAGIPIFAAVVVGTILTCISWRLSFGFFAIRFALIFGVAAVIASFWPQLQQRYAGMSLEEEYLDPTVDGRGIYLRLGGMIAREHFFGVGLNNWSYYVSLTYGPRLGFRFTNYPYLESVYGTADDKLFGDSYLAAPAHNLAALTLGELGIPGLVLFTFL